MSTLELRNLRKSFGTQETLKDISLSLEAGEFLVLLGASGCGKSTLLSLISGLASPSSGDIFLDGRRLNDVAPKDRDIAMVFQSYALYPNLSVARNIGFGLEMRGVTASEREAAIQDTARILQIEPLLSRKPAELSGGQRQRVAIGRAMVRAPRLFLFDEPLSNLDAKLRNEMRSELKRLHQLLGVTVVYVTHDQIEAMTLASRIAVLREGKIEQLGTPEEIYRKPASTFVASFIGSPSMNFLPAAAVPLALPAAAHSIGLRPEALSLSPRAPERIEMRADVTMVEFTGPERILTLDYHGHRLVALCSAFEEICQGQSLSLWLAREDLHLFDAQGARL